MSRRVRVTLLTLLILIVLPQMSTLTAAAAGDGVISETLTLTVYLDGFVLIQNELEVNQSYPAVDVTLLSQTCDIMLFLDEQNLPLDYAVTNRQAIVYSLGASKVRISYITQELTSKLGQYWTLRAEVALNSTVILPESATVISLSEVPEQIETSGNGQITLVMPPGEIEITYAVEYVPPPEQTSEQTTDAQIPWQLIGIIAIPMLLIPALAAALLVLKRKKPEAQETATTETVVDKKKLLAREKDLRPDEVKVVHFLAEKNGEAFEAELYDKLELPRTTTWRLLKRLEKMEIVEIRKSRRQNIISIKKKYLKSTKKA